MIFMGTIMAVAAGWPLPLNAVLFGHMVDFYIAYDLSVQLSNNANATDTTTTEYFCTATETSTSAKLNEFLNSTDAGSLLMSKTGLVSLCFVGLGTGMLIASFFSTLFWDLSAYRQTHRLRKAFFEAIMRQEIGWFDVNPSTQLSSRLSE